MICFFFKQKTAYEMRISDWSSDVCSSDLIKYGHLLEAAFKEPGGERLRGWIDSCPNQLYSALTFQGGAAWRKRLLDDLGDQGAVSALIERRSDDELARLMTKDRKSTRLNSSH